MRKTHLNVYVRSRMFSLFFSEQIDYVALIRFVPEFEKNRTSWATVMICMMM